VLDILRYCRRH